MAHRELLLEGEELLQPMLSPSPGWQTAAEEWGEQEEEPGEAQAHEAQNLWKALEGCDTAQATHRGALLHAKPAGTRRKLLLAAAGSVRGSNVGATLGIPEPSCPAKDLPGRVCSLPA